MGVWYEIGSIVFVKVRIECDLICVIVWYLVILDGDFVGFIWVCNEGYNIRIGEFVYVIGIVMVVSFGWLEVKFFFGVFGGDYCIIYLLGKVEDKYNVVIVYSCDESVLGGF